MSKVISLISGLFGEYVMADCIIEGEYFDFISSENGFKLVNQYGIEAKLCNCEGELIESILRQQYENMK